MNIIKKMNAKETGIAQNIKRGFFVMMFLNIVISIYSITNIWISRVSNAQLMIPLIIVSVTILVALFFIKRTNKRINKRLINIKAENSNCEKAVNESAAAAQEMASNNDELQEQINDCFIKIKEINKANEEGNHAVKEVINTMQESADAVELVSNTAREMANNSQELQKNDKGLF